MSKNLNLKKKIKSIKDTSSKYPNNELNYVLDVLDSNKKKTNYVYELEKRFSKLFKVKYAIACNSGTSGLHACLAVLNLKSDDEVIVPALSVVMDAYAAIHCNAKPVFSDVDKDSFLITADTIKSKITKKTKAVIAVSLQGMPIDIDPIIALSNKHKFVVIEDNAQDFYGLYKGRIAGKSGDMSMWSFENKKHLSGASEGGIVTTNNRTLAKKIRKFSGIGYVNLNENSKTNPLPLSVIQNPNYKRFDFIGLNYRMPEIVAAVALGQLENFSFIVDRRIKVAKILAKVIENCDWLVPQATKHNHKHTYYSFAIQYFGKEKFGVTWKKFYDDFKKMGGDGFYAANSPIYLEPSIKKYFKNKYNVILSKKDCPIAVQLQSRIIQFKTNYRNLHDAYHNAGILSKLIKKYNNLPPKKLMKV